MEQFELMPARVKIASIVRKAILSGEFAAGQELSLTKTAEMLGGVSRTPVREAFQILASEGLIELRMNKGAIVKPIDEAFIRDHFGMRILLEGEAVYRATQLGMAPGELDTMQSKIELETNLATNGFYEEYNLTFHTKIWIAAGSPKLYNLCESLWNGPSFSKAVSDEEHRRRSIAEHKQILLFIARGKAEDGRKAMTNHLHRSMQNMLDGLHMI